MSKAFAAEPEVGSVETGRAYRVLTISKEVESEKDGFRAKRGGGIRGTEVNSGINVVVWLVPG